MLKPILLVCFVASTLAWWGTGHHLVAKIAEDELLEKAPQIHEKAVAILQTLQWYVNDNEQEHPFIECAAFADTVKVLGWSLQKHWHYADNPIVVGGVPHKPAEPINATWSIGESIRILRYARTPTGYFKDVSYEPGNSFHMRLLIHYVGDIHQPLHAAERFTPEIPTGDRGGNSFKLNKQKYGIKNLHSLWDSAVFKYGSKIKLPVEGNQWYKLAGWADDIRENYPRESFSELGDDYTKWSLEGYEIAKEYVYTDIEENGDPSDEYIERGQIVCDKQLAKAGYRLADILLDIWGGNEEDMPEQSEEDFHQDIEIGRESSPMDMMMFTA